MCILNDQRNTQNALLTILQVRHAQRLAPKVYTYKKRVISATRAVIMRVDQSGGISQLRPYTIKPSELTGWVVTRTGPPISAATTASPPTELPKITTLPDVKTSTNVTSSDTTVTKRTYSIEQLKTLGKTDTGPPHSHTTLSPGSCSIGCLKAFGNASKLSGIEDGFEVVSMAELDDEEFDVVNGEGPSATNGAKKDIGMDEIASAFRSVWETYK